MAKIHLTYKKSKKLISMDETEMDLIEEVRKNFQIPETKKLIAQIWLPEIDDYVDIGSDIQLEYSVNAVQKILIQDDDDEPACDSTAMTTGNTVPEPNHVDKQYRRPVSHNPEPRQKQPFPVEYKLSDNMLRADVKAKQASGEPLSDHDITTVLNLVYRTATCVYENGFYPSEDNYTAIALGLAKAFPQVLKGELINEAQQVEWWKKKVIRRWQNGRQRESSRQLEVLARKKKQKQKVQPPRPSGPQRYGVTNYLPVRPDSEDDDSLERHIERLQLMHRKKEQDQSKVEDLMRLTLCIRRVQIVEETMSIQSVLKTYPYLNTTEGIVQEFQRIGPRMPETDPRKAIMNGLSMYSARIIKLLKQKKKLEPEIRALINFSTDDEILRIYSQTCAAIMGIFSLLAEKRNSLFTEVENEDEDQDEVSMVKPVVINFQGNIVHSNTLFIVLDNTTVAECSNIAEATATLVASLYVFNLQYPASCANFLKFCIFALMQWEDGMDRPKKLVDLLAKLDRQI